MKNIVSLIFFITIFSGSVFAECSDAASEAYDGYRDARKAYRSDDLDSCQSYARKAYKHLSYAEDYASSCSCSAAESEAYDGYRYARKAYRSDDLDSCQSYARKAYKYASYAEDEANSCS